MALEPLTGADPGQVAGYRIRARLGAGGMGRVYLAFTPGGRPVALKVVRPEYGDDADFRARFRQEIQAARQVHGLFTAQVLDAGPDADPPWLVTAYVPGPSLAQAVREYGPMPPETVFQLIAGVAEALQAIHSAGVVHRDLKPSNVLLAPDGPRVIDFGIARAVEGTTVTRTGMRVGSPQYMAPEQIAGRSITPAIDVFALGSLAAFAALGRPPFGAGSEAAVMYRILHEPPELGSCEEPLRGVIERCMAKQPADRPEPAEIISACRVHTAGKTLEIAQSWLPAAMAAALGEHVAPPAPPLPGQPGAAPPGGAQPPGPEAPTAYPPGPDAPTAYPPPPAPGGVAAAAIPLPATGTAGTQALLPGGTPWPRHLSRTALIGGAGVAAVVIAAVAVGTTLLIVRGPAGGTGTGGHHGSGTSGSHHAGTSAAQGTGSSAAQAGGTTVPATPQPTLPPDLDRCVIGVWKGVNESVTNQINGQPVPFVGPGSTQTFRPNGRAKSDYGKSTVYRATVNGNKWTYVFHGYVTYHWKTKHGKLYDSGDKGHGSWQLLDNGVVNNSGPLTHLAPGASRYTCSSKTLQSFDNTGSVTLARELPKPQPGS